MGLPLTFETEAHDVVLGDLATLRLAVALRVPKQSYTFPDLDLTLADMEGELRFDYPSGTRTDNVVNTLKVGEIRWRDYRVHDGWLSATFDQKGVNGNLGGSAYSGYVNGGASIRSSPRRWRAGPRAPTSTSRRSPRRWAAHRSRCRAWWTSRAPSTCCRTASSARTPSSTSSDPAS